MSGSGKVVCVTGASGYIASWLVKFLLQRGYIVRASVRDTADPKKTEHLRALDGAEERLQLFQADLLKEGSFDDVVEGCEGVFHTASPVHFVVHDPQADLIDPAVKGTLNVLASCAKTSSVKRVVITSSMSAVTQNGKPKTLNVVVDETWFSIAEIYKQSKLKRPNGYCLPFFICNVVSLKYVLYEELYKMWYGLSKTLAEEAAWKFSKDNAVDMVSINPSMVIGPLLQPTLNSSVVDILNLINGSSTFPNITFGWVNVQDVAMAHILAYEVPSATGRYCVVERVLHYSELVKIIHELYPAFQFPEKCADGNPFVPVYQVSKDKMKTLGIVNLIPLETSIKETIESCRKNGLVNF
ncbi:phenylacetaldehyde reductase-like isoform X1 [Typha latifolia]|uniref:phenylacetaldehyde reductase-like isoform X1 n=1 Tax=Typha latifolia TaxID=4733 RepID=UPI003C2BEEB5